MCPSKEETREIGITVSGKEARDNVAGEAMATIMTILNRMTFSSRQ